MNLHIAHSLQSSDISTEPRTPDLGAADDSSALWPMKDAYFMKQMHKYLIRTWGSVAQLMPWATIHGIASAPLVGLKLRIDQIEPGDVFLVLRPLSADVLNECKLAIDLGAVGVYADWSFEKAKLPGVYTRTIFRDIIYLAAKKRHGLAGKFVAIVGGNGKTTVTQMLGSIFQNDDFAIPHSTFANENNALGVALTLINTPAQSGRPVHCAVELGTSSHGEISTASRIVSPDIVLINNAQREHLDHFVNIRATALENGAAIRWLRRTGSVIYPVDDDMSGYWRLLAKDRKKIRFSLSEKTDAYSFSESPAAVAIHIRGRQIRVNNRHLIGRHNLHNMLSAVTCANHMGIQSHVIEKALTEFKPIGQRLERKFINSISVIDDTYNANPDSMIAALDSIRHASGRKLAIFGDMSVCAHPAGVAHHEVGAYAKAIGIDAVWGLGPLSQETVNGAADVGRHYADIAALASNLEEIQTFEVILIKGSRTMKMEFVSQLVHSHLLRNRHASIQEHRTSDPRHAN